MKKIFVTDLDGTLIMDGGKILNESIESIKKVNNSNNIFTFATARSLHMTQKYIRDFQIKHPVILSDGAMVYDPVNNKILFAKYINKNIVELIIDFIVKEKINCGFYTMNEIFVYYENEFTIKWKESVKVSENEIDVEFNPNLSIHNSFDHIKNMFNIVHKIMFILDEDKIKHKIFKFLDKNKINYKEISVDFSYIEIRPENVDKALGIREISKIYGVDYKDLIVFGNEHNDIEMFKQAKISYAVGNASDELKKYCTKVIDNVEKNGVGKKVEEIINEK